MQKCGVFLYGSIYFVRQNGPRLKKDEIKKKLVGEEFRVSFTKKITGNR